MAIKYHKDKITIAIMLKDLSGDFMSSLSDTEDKFLRNILTSSLDVAIKTILGKRKQKELCDELER